MAATDINQNTQATYGSVARGFHWLTAFLIILVVPLGVIAHDMPFDTADDLARKAELFRWHKSIGVVIFFVALARILWAITQPRPAPLHPERRLETFAAEVVHFVLYGALVLVPLTGWIHHAATEGFAPLYFGVGDSLPFVPKDAGVAEVFSTLHMTFERVMIAALLLHIAGAIKHAVWDRDLTVARMTRGAAPENLGPGGGHAVPALTAAGVFAAVLGGIAATGGLQTEAAGFDVPALASVESDWVVESGTLEIEVVQFGTAVTGSFADWTAAISYDDGPRAGDERGSVDVTIAIGSLTLGTVTDQALGPDYFDATVFTTATFAGPIVAEGEELFVNGTLTIRDVSQPLRLPFTLSIDEGVAQASGSATLQRLDFGVGENMADGSSLGLDVIVRVELTASKDG